MAEFRRFFADKSCFDNEFGIIEGNEFNHIKKVLRLRAGDEIIVCFNDGVDNLCEIVEICDKNIKVKINSGLLKAYEEALNGLINDIRSFCMKRSVDFITVSTDEAIERVLFGELFKTGILS